MVRTAVSFRLGCVCFHVQAGRRCCFHKVLMRLMRTRNRADSGRPPVTCNLDVTDNELKSSWSCWDTQTPRHPLTKSGKDAAPDRPGAEHGEGVAVIPLYTLRREVSDGRTSPSAAALKFHSAAEIEMFSRRFLFED